ncbi:MAG: hypothetical protein ACR2O1_00840 [Boseongicola sp.]
MTLSWSDWVDQPSDAAAVSPYVDWYRVVNFRGAEEADGLSLKPLPQSPSVGGAPTPVPLPDFARPDNGEEPSIDPRIELTWMPDPDSAIVGVIDSAIALSHARTRRIDNGTRFLSTWLQAGDWRPGTSVPFGRELFRTEIDRLMWRATVGGEIDEGLFDRAAGLTQFAHMRGDRRLEANGTHGTHVTDLCAGFDLSRSEFDEPRRRLPLIGVGLPPRSCIGASGNFLEFFAIHAIDYILDRADRIWAACEYGEGSFPVVINLSYGLQAGPKDGQMLIEKVIRQATARAEQENRIIRIVLPVGNDLLSEGAAKLDLSAGVGQKLFWRLKPEDHTPNYAEVWSDVLKGRFKPGSPHPQSVKLAPPAGPKGPSGAGKDGQIATLTDSNDPTIPLARIYCRAADDAPLLSGDPTRHRMVYVLCTRPTLNSERTQMTPAGSWTIEVEPSGKGSATAWAYVQSDQSLTHGSETGLVSTFAHPDFEPFDEFGRLIDAYSYTTPPVQTDTTPPIRRLGTMNAIAHNDAARVIGSYRMSDGKPSVFSSAADPSNAVGGRVAPSALLPGENGAARFGLLAAGSKSGSSIAMAGTSFSTALATRRIAMAILEWIDGGRIGTAPGDENWFDTIASNEDAAAQHPNAIAPAKGGFGRMEEPETGRIER